MSEMMNSNKKLEFFESYSELVTAKQRKAVEAMAAMHAVEGKVKLALMSHAHNEMAKLTTGTKESGGLLEVMGKGCETLLKMAEELKANKVLSAEFKRRVAKAAENLSAAKSLCAEEFPNVAIRIDGEETWTNELRAEATEAMALVTSARKEFILQLKEMYTKCNTIDTNEAFRKLGQENEEACNRISKEIASLVAQLEEAGIYIGNMIDGLVSAANSFSDGLGIANAGDIYEAVMQI